MALREHILVRSRRVQVGEALFSRREESRLRVVVFLDELRQYLERPDTSAVGYVPDVAAHRRHVVNRLAELERAGSPDGSLLRKHEVWTSDRVQRFARVMGEALLGDFAHGSSAEEVSQWINIALERELDLVTSTGSRVKDRELDRLRNLARFQCFGPKSDVGERVTEYALQIRAVRRSSGRRLLTPIGNLVQELPDRDAIRWLVAAEVVQSLGSSDEWRLSSEAAAFLLQNQQNSWHNSVDFPAWPFHWHALRHFEEIGIITLEEDDYSGSYSLLPAGAALLQEIASGKDTPFTLLIQALLQDETAAVIAQVRPVGLAAQIDSSVDATARHARMVAHEIRNALVPLQSAVESLYRDLDRPGTTPSSERRRGIIDGAIDRMFRFLDDISRIADLASAPSDLFEMAPAIQDAIAAVGSSSELTILFEKHDALPAVKGHRDRFVLALVNVLRNAAQARPLEGLQIRVSAGTHNGAEVFVAVDDNGPGVPVEQRVTIFEPGVSLRPHGSGQGLALVREVIEAEMAGRAVCEQSALGGARIVLRLPVGAKRK